MTKSKTYISLVSQLNENLEKWKIFINNISIIINQYTDNITQLLSQLDDKLKVIDGLQIYINKIDERVNGINEKIQKSISDFNVPMSEYIKVEYANINIISSKTEVKKTITVFSNVDKVYLFSNKTINGIKIDDKDIVAGESFYNFAGSITGEKIYITIPANILQGEKFILSFNKTGNIDDHMDATVEIKVELLKISFTPIISPTTYDTSAVISKFNNALTTLENKSIKNDDIIQNIELSGVDTRNMTVLQLAEQLGIINKSINIDKSNNTLIR